MVVVGVEVGVEVVLDLGVGSTSCEHQSYSIRWLSVSWVGVWECGGREGRGGGGGGLGGLGSKAVKRRGKGILNDPLHLHMACAHGM